MALLLMWALNFEWSHRQELTSSSQTSLRVSGCVRLRVSNTFLGRAHASPEGPLAALFHIIFMLNFLVPPEEPPVAGSDFRKEYSTVKLFLRWPRPRLHTNNSRKQKRTTPRKVMQPIAVETKMVVRSKVNLRKTRVLFRFVSLKNSPLYSERLRKKAEAASSGWPRTVSVAK